MTQQQYLAFNRHYDQFGGTELHTALYFSTHQLQPDLLSLDSELHDFLIELWKRGYKIIPVA